MATSDAAALMLRKAAGDLQALRHMQDVFAFDDTVFGFHAQQACEKSCKSWLLHLGRRAPKIHDMRDLVALLAEAGVSLDDEEAIVDMTDFAVEWRYDEDPAEPIDRPATVVVCERLYARVAEVTGLELEKR